MQSATSRSTMATVQSKLVLGDLAVCSTWAMRWTCADTQQLELLLGSELRFDSNLAKSYMACFWPGQQPVGMVRPLVSGRVSQRSGVVDDGITSCFTSHDSSSRWSATDRTATTARTSGSRAIDAFLESSIGLVLLLVGKVLVGSLKRWPAHLSCCLGALRQASNLTGLEMGLSLASVLRGHIA